MSSQLASIVPCAPLTDDVFPFNQSHFLEIRKLQDNDLGFLSSPPVRAIVEAGDIAGSTATGVTTAVGQGVRTGTTSLFGGIGKLTSGLPGGSLLHTVGQGALGVVDTADHAAQQLVDPTRVVREHIHYSNDIKDHLPAAINAIDDVVHDFASEIGHVVQDLYENIATKGISIITGLEGRLAQVGIALSKLYEVLTTNNIVENLKVGHDKYKAIQSLTLTKNFLGELSDELPKVLKIITDVKGAFEKILANLTIAKQKINAGVTDPGLIFAEKHEDVTLAWQTFEVKRKTLTYLPYKY